MPIDEVAPIMQVGATFIFMLNGKFSAMSDEESPDHPIIDRPWEFEIRYFAYRSEPDRWLESYIDMTLVRGDSIRRLRFTAPQELEMANGFPVNTKGLQIQDVSQRRMENVGVRVDCFEMDGVISFWAKDVMDLDLAE